MAAWGPGACSGCAGSSAQAKDTGLRSKSPAGAGADTRRDGAWSRLPGGSRFAAWAERDRDIRQNNRVFFMAQDLMSLRRMVSSPKQARRLWLCDSGSEPRMRLLSWNQT